MLISLLMVITMKTINIAITEKAHQILSEMCRKAKKNQSDIIIELLEVQQSC